MAVGVGKTLDKSKFLIESIKNQNHKQEIHTFVANEELDTIPKQYIKYFEDNTKLHYGEIPMKEYIFTVKHNALIKAGNTKKEYLCCLDSDMLMLRPFEIPTKNMYVCPVDIGNTSWGREESRPLWEELYKIIKVPMPLHKLTPLVDNYKMFPYFNGGFVLTNNKTFGSEWLSLTKKIYKIIEKYDSYDKYRGQSKRRRTFTRIPYSHWTEQVSLTLLATKYNAEVLGYDYDYPINIMHSCPCNTRLIHYHDFRNLYKLNQSKIMLINGLSEYLKKNYKPFSSKLKLNAYSIIRRAKIKMGKF